MRPGRRRGRPFGPGALMERWLPLGLASALAGTTPGAAQDLQVRTQLMARGAPAEFVEQIATIVNAAAAEGLPTTPLVTKALEGWAKRGRVPPERVVMVVRQVHGRLRAGREVALGAGLDPPPGAVVAAAAEALGRGMAPDDLTRILGGAPGPAAAATGLTVASAMAAQGLQPAAAVRVVQDAYRAGRSPQEVLEFPSAVTGLRARGESLADVGRRILEGGGLPLLSHHGMGGRPEGMPGARSGAGAPRGTTKRKGKANRP